VHSADQERWVTHLRQRLMRQSPAGDVQDIRLIARDDRECWIEHSCKLAFVDDGRYLGRRGVNREITERRGFEDALQWSEDFLNATGRMARVGVWELDTATHAMRWTRGVHDLFEIPLEVTPSYEEGLNFCHPADRDKLAQSMEQAMTLGQAFDLQSA
jgi:PAS domain-containing protein